MTQSLMHKKTMTTIWLATECISSLNNAYIFKHAVNVTATIPDFTPHWWLVKCQTSKLPCSRITMDPGRWTLAVCHAHMKELNNKKTWKTLSLLLKQMVYLYRIPCTCIRFFNMVLSSTSYSTQKINHHRKRKSSKTLWKVICEYQRCIIKTKQHSGYNILGGSSNLSVAPCPSNC